MEHGITEVGTMVVKTAVSLPEKIFKRVNAEARKRKVSRSRAISTMLEEHWKRIEEDKLVERINAAYANHELSEEDRAWLDGAMRLYAETLADEKW